jgi:hypothetical protein
VASRLREHHDGGGGVHPVRGARRRPRGCRAVVRLDRLVHEVVPRDMGGKALEHWHLEIAQWPLATTPEPRGAIRDPLGHW